MGKTWEGRNRITGKAVAYAAGSGVIGQRADYRMPLELAFGWGQGSIFGHRGRGTPHQQSGGKISPGD